MSDRPEDRSRRIYLTGFMASGKSTIGPILANTIGYEFFDVDALIEEAAGKTVPEIFREQGEDRFRAFEHEAILRVSALDHVVVSLGGGTLTHPANLDVVTGSGILVYLKVAPEEILRRVRHKNNRPLLNGPDGERLPQDELRKRVLALYEVREPVYEQADVVVIADETRVGLTVDRVVKLLMQFLRGVRK